MTIQNEEAEIMRTAAEEAQELAQNLDDWAQRELPEKQQNLLRQLLSRCEKKQIDIGEPAYAYNTDIKQAAMDALETINCDGNSLPISSAPEDQTCSQNKGWSKSPWSKWSNGIWPRGQ